MDSTSNSISRFRFRDHDGGMGDDDSSESLTSADTSSILSNEDEEPELQSMTAKGVQHLCSELLELKQESEDDFQKNIFANYSAFLAILKEIEGLQSELFELKHQASSQKRLIKDFSSGISLRVLSEETVESMLEEPPHVESSSPSLLETHTENVSEILDTLLSEHRLDDALALLEMEGDFVQNLLSGEKFSSDQLMSYHSTISEKRAMLADQFTLIAKHPRVSAPELQKAVSGLCQLGDTHLANQLMLHYYHSRITSGIYDLQSSKEFLDVLYIQELAKFVCSMISQAAKSFVALNGEIYPEITRWAFEEIEILASCLNKYIESISEISGKLSTIVEAVQMAMSYCSLLENQRIFLQPSLIEHISPCIEEVLRNHIDHLSKVIRIFTSSDNWALGRYYVSGMSNERNSAIIDQQPEYLFLTNSGRKLVTLFQQVAEDVSPLIALKMESSVLKGIMDLLTSYIIILESVLTGDTERTEKEGSKINVPESSTQGVFILANLSTLIQFSSSIIRSTFEGIHHLEFQIDNHLLFIQDIYSRLKACFLKQFISNIFSPNVDHEFGPEICISRESDSRIYDLIPSVPYLELYLELMKLQKLAEDDRIDMNWLINLFLEVIDSTFEWISSKSEIWKISEENLADGRPEFMQFILDAQFLVEVARCGGYLSENVINVSSDIVSRLEASFVSAGLNPLRELEDVEWPEHAAVRALQKLQEFHAKELLENENSNTARDESHQHVPLVSNDHPFEDDDALTSGENSVDLLHSLVTVNAPEFAIDRNSEVSRTDDRSTTTEEEETVDLEVEEQNSLYKREFYRDVETERTKADD
ncbi:hypothetical protein BUALT_Bualt02G0201600 [Buddleja alternifolia]|uniref:Exocyst component Exo84 C-terminal domain-containing protein n=1 Tax=Buddleja alternifolia TaxID=168488 RepID=A0AAV6Y2Y9_9LAMI|nr:hypothetical protein BUALT_Bualt02G0201600 [Buddleja alternifolia]